MSKSIWVDDLKNNSTYSSNGLALTGIGALGGVANNDGLSSFSSGNRANINKSLVQRLKGYADAFRFKVYKWEET